MLQKHAGEQKKKFEGKTFFGGWGGNGFESRASDDIFFIRLIQLSYKTL